MARVASFVVVSAVCAVAAMFVLGVIGAAVEGVGDWQVEHERCLKHAANGYDIWRCR